MKFAMIVMTLTSLTFVALVALVVAIYYRAGNTGLAALGAGAAIGSTLTWYISKMERKP